MKRIPLDVLGRSDNYGFYISVFDGNTENYYSWPNNIENQTSFFSSPSQWGDLISPDKSLPEFHSTILFSIVISLMIIFVTITKLNSFRLGNGSSLTADTNVTDLNSEITGDGLERAAGTLGTFTAVASNGADATQRISNSFTYNGSQTGNVISQAGLFNQTTISGDGTFALKNFPSNVTMNTNDQLTVNWDITIAGSDAVSSP